MFIKLKSISIHILILQFKPIVTVFCQIFFNDILFMVSFLYGIRYQYKILWEYMYACDRVDMRMMRI